VSLESPRKQPTTAAVNGLARWVRITALTQLECI
jgi:hypothetical protein